MGSKIVRADTCFDVEGSNKTISPLPLPVDQLAIDSRIVTFILTKSDISVVHPRSYSQIFVAG